ncbi:hypothetical protein ABZ508_33415 [Streptomyces lavendulocolor]|uniref:Uncharacterized protein n=1 Tax=Streptomyces lavendulocolor TaxID=67316 RepID=A0ABV2WFY4_9ACTN
MSIRIHLTDGQREVTIKLDGNDATSLQQAERVAKRLFIALTRTPEPSRPAFGFSLDGTTLAAETERAAEERVGDDEGDE